MDVFWIAEEYLGIPSEFYPRSISEDRTYEKYRERWLEKNQSPVSYADFSQVKYGLRRATFKKDFKPDLTNWLHKIGVYLEGDKAHPLYLRSIYEICMASLRGLNNLTAKGTLVEEYFSRVDQLTDIPELRDATTLLIYCSTAFGLGHFHVDVTKLSEWSQLLIGQIDKGIRDSCGHGMLCTLYLIRSTAATLPYQESPTPKIYIDDVFFWWSKLIDEVDKAPLFPLEDFADILTTMTDVLGEDKRFLAITQKTDELLTRRSSGYIAAEKCRDRAMVYYTHERYLQAIRQLHQAKVQWFSAETLRGSLLAMLVLSDCYQRLGLIYPAKYYAAGVAFVAHQQDRDEIKDLLPRAMLMLADSCYQGGEWMNFVCIGRWALTAHCMYEEDPFDINKHQAVLNTFVHTAIVRALVKRFDTCLLKRFNEIFENWPIDQGTRKYIEHQSDTTGPWSSAPVDEICRLAQAQLAGRPFSDVGGQRTIRWKALGILWTVEFDNDQATISISEELVSTLQIILADLAMTDLLLLPTKVAVHTYITDGVKLDVEEVPSNAIATWKVGFPRNWIRNLSTLEDVRNAVLALAVTVLGKCSALDGDRFLSEIRDRFVEGLTYKIFSVRPYSELYCEFMPEDQFDLPVRKSLGPLFSAYSFDYEEHEQLAWIHIDGPGYSNRRANQFLKNRYEKGIRPIRKSLPRLLRDQGFLGQIRKLIKDGYLDWEILLIVANICVDDYVKVKLGPMASLEKQMHLTKELMFGEEAGTGMQTPPTIFTDERIAIQRKVLLASVANTWGLTLHQQTPDFEALERLLDVRYHNSQDDIPHPDLFASCRS